MTEQVLFGEWLRKQRRALDLSRQALADQVGCAEITLRRIETGTLKPSRELALLLLEKIGVPQMEREDWIRFARGQSGMPSQAAPISKPAPRTNLPASLTSFIGREKEQAETIRLITKHRLVTLIGPGGIGKTRLSLKVGDQLLEKYPDGVWLVELASLNRPDLLPQTIAALFDLKSTSNRPSLEILIDFLQAKNILLMLDNCEHLLDACAQLADHLLKHCPNLKILATSREGLGVMGEASYQVPALELPDVRQILEKLRDFESVSLFEERAQLVQTGFTLTMDNASAVAQICSRLDGIPLAIELAAVHVNTLSPAEIAAQLAECFQILTGGNRAALPRQQTIRASIEWSWNLLSEPEKILLRRLSVFAGGWTLESAQAVCDGEVLSLTDALVRKSLIAAELEAEHATRYRFHEIVRQYAREKLIEAGEEENTRSRHLKFILEFSEQLALEVQGPQQAIWHVRAFYEVDNVRLALQWADKTDVQAGLYLSSRLAWLWYNFDLREGNEWLSRFLQKPESHTYPQARLQALYMYGDLMTRQQQFEAARSAAEEGVELSRTLGDQRGEMDSLLLLARGPLNPAQRAELNRQALEMAQTLGDTETTVRVLWELGRSERLKGSQTFEHWKKAITLARPLENWRMLANMLSMLGDAFVLNGEVESAQPYLDEADMLYKKLNLLSPTSQLLSAYGQIAFIRGDFEKARAYFQDTVRIGIEIGSRSNTIWGRAHLGYVALREGNLAEARRIFHETARSFQQDSYELGVAFTLEGIAGLYIATAHPEHAAQLIGWADATREKIGETRPRVEQADVDKTIAACIARMGEVAFADAYEQGRKMTLEEAITFALEEN